MIEFTPQAERQLTGLQQHYERLERSEALRNLETAIADAVAKIKRNPAVGLAAPRPYPFLAKPGRAWVKAGRYWFSYSTTQPLVITGIFYDTAHIPTRGG